MEFATEPNGPDYPNPLWSTFLLRNLLENEEFKRNFINRFSNLLNTIFKKEHISEIIDTLTNVIKPEMEEHRARWSQSYNGWQNGINYLHTYAENRDENLITHFQNKFSLDDLASVNLDSGSEKGVIKINSLTIKRIPMVWQIF